MIEALLANLAQTSALEYVSVFFNLAYVILAARENIWCWPAALIGTATGIFLFWDASLVMESGLNIFYLLMAVFGWWSWLAGGHDKSALPIRSWQGSHHCLALALIALLTLISGYFLQSRTDAALPYVDSFTTWGAVIATWMVARKILENWLYWIVIDAVAVWLFLQRDLALYALLFMVYTIVAVYGYFHWRGQAQLALRRVMS